MGDNPIKSVGIAGAGTMGQGIAISCALAGYDTLLFDVNTGACAKAIDSIQISLDQSVAKGKLSPDEATSAKSRIRAVNVISDLKANLIIEAVVENLKIKQQLFADLEEVNSPTTIFATNTSSIPVSTIALTLKHPSRFVGLHFFNPAHVMRLVEVISGEQTDSELVSVMKSFSISLGKAAVEVKDSPGFIVNRVARHFYVESLKLLEDGIADHETIDQLMRSSGFKMGPFELMDLIGIDVNYSVTESVYEGFNKALKFKPSKIQDQKIKAGELGRKTGKGFYEYKK
ncbi:MAG: 3-hydroxybutyryl-CoA dehydrogenase [Cyclobacteriaceae bacterium]|nr:3-hydroxybutyryl-CoA dehydrogenase [Cyclobacteriaceae bacterium]